MHPFLAGMILAAADGAVELGWHDGGPSPKGGRKRRWVGTPPDKGVRHQISEPGSRGKQKKGKPVEKEEEPRHPQGKQLKRQAAEARKLAAELRAAGQEGKADHLERVASRWDSGQPGEGATEPEKPVPTATDSQLERQSPVQERPRYRVQDDSPRGASLRMNSFLEAYIDRKVLAEHPPRGGDIFQGVGVFGREESPVFPIEGKFYVVDFGASGNRFTQALREVPESGVRFHKKRRKPRR